MSGRIRSLKPELLDLECAAALTSDAWRVWVSMMLLADDHGNLRAAPKLLAAHCFHDTGKVAVVEAALAELGDMPEECRVVLFRVGAELFAHLGGWSGGTCPAVEQYISRVGKGRVPRPDDPRAELAPMVPSTSKSNAGKSRAVSSNGVQRRALSTTVGDLPRQSPRARTPISDHDHDPRSPIPDPAAALPLGQRASEATAGSGGGGGADEDPGDPPAPSSGTPAAAPASSPPTVDPSPPLDAPGGHSAPSPAARPRRPRYEGQLDGLDPLIDPVTGAQLVLDLARLSAAEVAAERHRCLLATLPGPVKVAPRPTPPAPLGLVEAPIPSDPTGATRAILAAAPPPICYLAESSAERVGSGLLGGQLRIDDVRAGVAMAASKLPEDFVGLTADMPADMRQRLHNWIAGCVMRAPKIRRASREHEPPPAASEAGEKLLARWCQVYERAKGDPYAAGDDDALHATEIATALGKRLDADRVREPSLDVTKARPRMVVELFDAWLGDVFGARSGYALGQLARLLRTEPNRFRLGVEPAGRGAADVAPDPPPPEGPRAISAEDRAQIDAQIRGIGARAMA